MITRGHAAEGRLKFIRYLDDPDNDLVRVAILVEQTKFDHRIVFPDVALDVDHLVVLEVLFDFFLENIQRVGEINFDGTWVVGCGLHSFLGSRFQVQCSMFVLSAFDPGTLNLELRTAESPPDQRRSPCKATAEGG